LSDRITITLIGTGFDISMAWLIASGGTITTAATTATITTQGTPVTKSASAADLRFAARRGFSEFLVTTKKEPDSGLVFRRLGEKLDRLLTLMLQRNICCCSANCNRRSN
jgi:hypothetical protein